MKSKNTLIYTLAVICIAFTSCSQDDDGIFFKNEDTSLVVNYSDIEYEILDLVNQHRQDLGLNPLDVLNVVSKEAISHTNYMLNKGEPSHDNFQIRYANLRNAVNAKNVSENVAFGYRSAQAVVNAWLNSAKHKEIIENKDFTDFGISTKSNDEGKNYFTHIFIKR